MVAPKIMQRLHNAALKYPEWKARHEPEWRPWLITNVMLAEMPIINMHDVLNSPDFDVRERLNEMNITEEAATRSEEAATAAGN
ncbi:unnamed protein product [Protopolystoma xenopodis]|uniref:Uncharacterized protein n=1 Tax=Protopolystoma xenopodis TaxID=117903 RepID=A0A448WTI0_9PLAT|nr:unnamed protein product [Protopolystoma xenopodis]